MFESSSPILFPQTQPYSYFRLSQNTASFKDSYIWFWSVAFFSDNVTQINKNLQRHDRSINRHFYSQTKCFIHKLKCNFSVTQSQTKSFTNLCQIWWKSVFFKISRINSFKAIFNHQSEKTVGLYADGSLDISKWVFITKLRELDNFPLCYAMPMMYEEPHLKRPFATFNWNKKAYNT